MVSLWRGAVPGVLPGGPVGRGSPQEGRLSPVRGGIGRERCGALESRALPEQRLLQPWCCSAHPGTCFSHGQAPLSSAVWHNLRPAVFPEWIRPGHKPFRCHFGAVQREQLQLRAQALLRSLPCGRGSSRASSAMESLVGNRITLCCWGFAIQAFQHDNSTMFECV